jgi:two-component system osmolarity sensor histidine kinase EnvZ
MVRFWPKSLFVRNLVLLITFAVVVQFSTIAVYMLLQRPRVVELGSLVATQINTLQSALSGVPVGERGRVIGTINGAGRILIIADARPPRESADHSMLMDLFQKTVRSRVSPDIDLRWVNEPRSEVWATVGVGNERYWIVIPILLLRDGWLGSTVSLFLAMAFMATIVALLIQRRVNRPLRQIADAARKLGEGGRPERLPQYSSTELDTVANQFNLMTQSLEAMESSRAVMLAGISHDIRTPLTKLRLSLAMEERSPEKSVSRYIDQIDAIVGQFLDYGRTASDEPTIEGDLNTLIMQIAGEFEERGAVFELQLQKLPVMRFRPIAMLRVIRNLMDNAAKYGRQGLEVRTWHVAREVGISVLDSGPGISRSDSERLLQPFIRADAGRSSVSGTGLGLAIADRFARLHAGSVYLSPRASGGLEACVRLPCLQVSPAVSDIGSVETTA